MTYVFIAAIENSGDQLGAGLIRALRKQAPNVKLSGVGGPAMEAQGVSSPLDMSPLAVLGFIEPIKVYPLVVERVKQLCQLILDTQPDSVVLIDSWGFMIRLAKALKKSGYKGQVIKYVAPQVWAMREGRARILAQHVDHVLSLHSFDAPYFERYGLPVTYVGNPVLETDCNCGDGEGLKKQFKISAQDIVISIFFGSRLSEIQQLAKPFADAISLISEAVPNARFISPVSDVIATDVAAAAAQDMRLQKVILLPESRKFDVFAASDVALACSGTVTTQLACAGVPAVVGYRLNPLTYHVARHLYKPAYISIVNIAADSALMPEYMQKDCNGTALADGVLAYVHSETKRRASRQALLAQTAKMRGQGGSADTRAAKAILSLTAEA